MMLTSIKTHKLPRCLPLALLLLALSACATLTPTVNPSVVSLLSPNQDALSSAARNTSVTVLLRLPNAKIDATTLRYVALRRSSDNAIITGMASADENHDTLTFTPHSPLEPATAYTFSVTAEVKDLSGVGFVPYSVGFTTEADATDPTPQPGVKQPRVTGLTSPGDLNAAPIDTAITVTLALPNGALDTATLAGVSLTHLGSNTRVAGTASANGNTLSFAPAATLEPATRYRFVVPVSVKDLSGASVTRYEVTFTTAPTPSPTPPPGKSPRIVSTTPADGATNVPANTITINAAVEFVASGVGVDLSTLNCDTIFLQPLPSGNRVCGNANGNAGFNAINFRSDRDTTILEDTTYRFELTAGVKDGQGNPFEPFTMTFTTGKTQQFGDRGFEQKMVFTGQNGQTVTYLAIGADGKLYGSSIEGVLRRWDIDPDTGELSKLQTYNGLQGRPIIGIAFDPKDANVLWLAHNNPVIPNTPACDFTGKVSKLTLSGSGFGGTLQDYVVNLPRSIGDHFSNGLRFGPDDKLYLAQGSHTHHGAPDFEWAFRPERKLSAGILQIDPRRTAGLPINVQTDPFDVTKEVNEKGELRYGNRCPVTNGSYNPAANNAPVKVYAAGLRNAYDLFWHSNGKMYSPVNGPNKPGNTPASPDNKVPATTNGSDEVDFLAQVKEGRYYGHPNPSLGHYVFRGGNPTNAQDPWQYGNYPAGVMPDAKWDPPIKDLGMFTSVNGIIEYNSPGKYQHHLIVAYFAAKAGVYALEVNPDGSVGEPQKIVSDVRANPLALVENPLNGDIYVAELFRGTPQGFIELLRPVLPK